MEESLEYTSSISFLLAAISSSANDDAAYMSKSPFPIVDTNEPTKKLAILATVPANCRDSTKETLALGTSDNTL